MHVNPLMPLGGSLAGTLPNPGLSADAVIQRQVFGPRWQAGWTQSLDLTGMTFNGGSVVDNGYLQVRASTGTTPAPPSGGVGVEIVYVPGSSAGVIQAYDRTNAAYKNLQIGVNSSISMGDVTVNSLVCTQTTTIAGIRLTKSDGSNTIWESDANQDLAITTNGGNLYLGAGVTTKNVAILNATGNVLVGSTTDDAVNKLQVNGGVAIRGSNGGYWQKGSNSELLTLSTAGTTTNTSGNLLPANSIIEAVTARVTTTITTATDWKLGDATTAGRFNPAVATLVAGTTAVGLTHADQTGAAGPIQSAAAKVRVTTTGTPGAGAIRITVFYRTFVAPTS